MPMTKSTPTTPLQPVLSAHALDIHQGILSTSTAPADPRISMEPNIQIQTGNASMTTASSIDTGLGILGQCPINAQASLPNI